jgi:hypothetical protein
MKIEESPYRFSGSSPVDKLKRTAAGPSDFSLEDLDLSFLDLLTAIASDVLPTETADQNPFVSAPADKKDAATAPKPDPGKGAPTLTLVGKVSSTASREADSPTQVEKDMRLLNSDLSAQDMQYLKQIVIPGLPILLGSVPFNSIFPSTPEGEISYKGFEVSPKLAELIEKGYKTGRPIRVELDNNSAVIMKIRDGHVSAEFVSSDKGAALAMQQELNDLRNKLALKNLPVGTLESKYQQSYRSGSDSDNNSDSKSGYSQNESEPDNT